MKEDTDIISIGSFDYHFILLTKGWNHRGVYVLSRSEKLQKPVKRKLSTKAHRRMRMDYHRFEMEKSI